MITRSVLEYDLMPADVVGVLKCVKLGFLRSIEEEYEDEGGDD